MGCRSVEVNSVFTEHTHSLNQISIHRTFTRNLRSICWSYGCSQKDQTLQCRYKLQIQAADTSCFIQPTAVEKQQVRLAMHGHTIGTYQQAIDVKYNSLCLSRGLFLSYSIDSIAFSQIESIGLTIKWRLATIIQSSSDEFLYLSSMFKPNG